MRLGWRRPAEQSIHKEEPKAPPAVPPYDPSFDDLNRSFDDVLKSLGPQPVRRPISDHQQYKYTVPPLYGERFEGIIGGGDRLTYYRLLDEIKAIRTSMETSVTRLDAQIAAIRDTLRSELAAFATDAYLHSYVSEMAERLTAQTTALVEETAGGLDVRLEDIERDLYGDA